MPEIFPLSAPNGPRERLYLIALSQNLGVGCPVLPPRFGDYTKTFHIEYFETMKIGLEYVPGFTRVRSNCEDNGLQNRILIFVLIFDYHNWDNWMKANQARFMRLVTSAR